MLLLNGDSDATAGTDENSSSNQDLVAAAISRLCLVLCAEWGKPTSNSGHGFNEFGFPSMPSPDNEQIPSSVLDFHRQLSGSNSSSHTSSGKKC